MGIDFMMYAREFTKIEFERKKNVWIFLIAGNQ